MIRAGLNMPKPACLISIIGLRPHYLVVLIKCRSKRLRGSVSMRTPVFVFISAYGVRLIRPAGKVTAAALQGARFPEAAL